MIKTIMVLPDGTEISSGTANGNALLSVSHSAFVNSTQELTLGSVCAAVLEAKIFAPDGGVKIAAGDLLQVYDQNRQKIGQFLAEKPEQVSRSTLKVTAYDEVSLLEEDLTQWLSEQSWPLTVYSLASLLCDRCGLRLYNESLPNGSFLVYPPEGSDITGRMVAQWLGQICGCFCRVTPMGELEFAWYTPVQTYTAGPSEKITWDSFPFSYEAGALTLQTSRFSRQGTAVTIGSSDWTSPAPGRLGIEKSRQGYYFQNGLSFSDYTVQPIEKVQLQENAEDVGTIYPDKPEAVNTYKITGNQLLSGCSKESRKALAKRLYQQLKQVSYTPCTVILPADTPVRAGHILQITDVGGHKITAYVMECKRAGQKVTAVCTGSYRRDSVSAVNRLTLENVNGKVLNLKTDIDGIRLENKAADGRMTALELTVEGISAGVTETSETAKGLVSRVSDLELSATAFSLNFQQIQENGTDKVTTETGYTFNKDGLHIERSGANMANKLDNTGMYVTRGGQAILTANDEGVQAVDVQVHNYLIVGEHARLEDYENSRTACFYIGG